MKAARLFLLVLFMAGSLKAGIVELNYGLDYDTNGNWSFSAGIPRDNTGATDTWLAQNAGHFLKAPYGTSNGTEAAQGFAGIYKGGGGDTMHMYYTFTANAAIALQQWVVKATIWRANEANSARLQFWVQVNGGGFSQVMNSDYFGRSADGAAYDLTSFPASGYGIDGPTATYSADLGSLNIQPGDNVVYRFTLAGGDALAGTTARRIGLGVQLVPEPSALGLWAVATGCCFVWAGRRMRRFS